MYQLTKETSQDALRNYFAGVIALSKSKDPFPVDLDDVWPLLYTTKGNAVRELKKNRKEGFDYVVKDENFIFNKSVQNKSESGNEEVLNKSVQNLPTKQDEVFIQNDKNLQTDGKDLGGRPNEKIFLSLSCLQEWVVRRVPGVFDVYLKVFQYSTRMTESLALSMIPNVVYYLTETAGISDIIDFISNMKEKEANGDKFPIFLPDVFNLVFPIMSKAIDELTSPQSEFVKGYHYTLKGEGTQYGYYLSFNGFNEFIACRSTLCKRAYERATELEIIPEMPKLLEFKATPTDVAATKKLIKIHNIQGDMREQVMEIQDRIMVLMSLSEEPEAKRMLNDALSEMVKLNNFLATLEEGE